MTLLCVCVCAGGSMPRTHSPKHQLRAAIAYMLSPEAAELLAKTYGLHATLFATVVVLGGFASTIGVWDFWTVTALVWFHSLGTGIETVPVSSKRRMRLLSAAVPLYGLTLFRFTATVRTTPTNVAERNLRFGLCLVYFLAAYYIIALIVMACYDANTVVGGDHWQRHMQSTLESNQVVKPEGRCNLLTTKSSTGTEMLAV
jgi:hypothetical protein